MKLQIITIVVAALMVGIISIGAGFGIDVGDSSLKLAKDALNTGIEGLIATLVAAIGGSLVAVKK